MENNHEVHTAVEAAAIAAAGRGRPAAEAVKRPFETVEVVKRPRLRIAERPTAPEDAVIAAARNGRRWPAAEAVKRFFETVETVKRPRLRIAQRPRLETVKQPSSDPASFTRTGASSSSSVRLPSARQTDMLQEEHEPGVEMSSVHY